MITAATVSGPSRSIVSATALARSSPVVPSGTRYMLVFGTVTPPGVSGSNGSFSSGIWVAIRAPRLVP